MARSLCQVLTVRLTKEQHDLLKQLREANGGGSLSDVARTLINEAMQRGSGSPTTEEAAVHRLESMSVEMHREIKSLLRRVEIGKRKGDSGASSGPKEWLLPDKR